MQELVKRGFGKMIAEYDGKLASAAGDKKALTRANVEQYLSEFGLDSELAAHSHLKGLSGGQKVKLVLAAAMWNHPHFLIMDEPTNYLDRDSLGALAAAIQGFQGGVLLISHNSEFTSALCPEVWAVDNGAVEVRRSFYRTLCKVVLILMDNPSQLHQRLPGHRAAAPFLRGCLSATKCCGFWSAAALLAAQRGDVF